jgi:hypothetical protein
MATLKLFKPENQIDQATVHWFRSRIDRAAKHNEVFGETVLVSPGFAGTVLDHNPDNRNIRETKRDQYAADMRAGRWTLNGEPIIVSKDGLLNDGQHRLSAVIAANLCIPLTFMFGLDRESRYTVDQGAARSADAYLSMEGVENATASATIARLLIAFETTGGADLDGKLVTNAAVRDRVHSDHRIIEAARYAVGIAKRAKSYAPGTVIGFCFYQFSKIDCDDAGQFLDSFCTGANLKPGAPALACRDRLLNMNKSRGPKIAVIFRAWNMYRRGVQRVKSNSLISTLPLPELI